MGYGLDGSGSIPAVQDLLRGPPSSLSNGYRGLFPREVNRQRREANHSPPYSDEDKKYGVIPPLPHISSWHSAQPIKHNDKFNL
jgi:hypothetical protein